MIDSRVINSRMINSFFLAARMVALAATVVLPLILLAFTYQMTALSTNTRCQCHRIIFFTADEAETIVLLISLTVALVGCFLLGVIDSFSDV